MPAGAGPPYMHIYNAREELHTVKDCIGQIVAEVFCPEWCEDLFILYGNSSWLCRNQAAETD